MMRATGEEDAFWEINMDLICQVARKCDGCTLMRLESCTRRLWQAPSLDCSWKEAFMRDYFCGKPPSRTREEPGVCWRDMYLERKNADANRAAGHFTRSCSGIVPGRCRLLAYRIEGDDLLLAAQPRDGGIIGPFQVQVWSLKGCDMVCRLMTDCVQLSSVTNMDVMGTSLLVGLEHGHVAMWNLPHMGDSGRHKCTTSPAWEELFSKDMTSLLIQDGKRFYCNYVMGFYGDPQSDITAKCNPNVPTTAKNEEKSEVHMLLIAQQESEFLVIVLSNEGEPLSKISLTSREVWLCRSCRLLIYACPNIEYCQILLRIGSWKVLGEDWSALKFFRYNQLSDELHWKICNRTSERVQPTCWTAKQFLLEDNFLVRYLRCPDIDSEVPKRRVMMGSRVPCECMQSSIHGMYSKEKNAKEQKDPNFWCFDLLPGEECVDVRVITVEDHLVLTRTSGPGSALPRKFRVWQAESGQLLRSFDMLHLMQSEDATQEIDSTVVWPCTNYYHADAQFLEGTGKEPIVCLEVHGKPNAEPQMPARIVGFWNVMTDEISTIQMEKYEQLWCDWKWLVTMSLTDDGYKLDARSFSGI